MPLIYEGHDEFLSREQSFGINEKPADYLLSFNDFIKNNVLFFTKGTVSFNLKKHNYLTQ